MRIIVMFLKLLLCTAITAQSWCPPGASWTFGVIDFFEEGYMRIEYVGDTMLEGTIAQKLDVTNVIYNHLNGNTTVNTYPAEIITSNDDQIVSLWSHAQSSWDTLYWISATPGQRWGIPHLDEECEPPGYVEVIDTSTVVIDGIELRQLEMVAVSDGQSNPMGVIVERLGWEWWMTLFPPCFSVDGPAGLRCYHDNEMSYTSSSWNYGCMSITGMPALGSLGEMTIYPNPGAAQLIISWNTPSPIHVEVLSVVGEKLIDGYAHTSPLMLDTRMLAPATYLVRMVAEDGQTWTNYWIKE